MTLKREKTFNFQVFPQTASFLERAYESVTEARASIGCYLDFYNGQRPHSSLDGAAPIKPTSPRCLFAWQPNPGRGSTYRRGKTVQTTRTTSGCPLGQ
jgi:putative transposase